jgi:hypothetical protein
MSRCVTSRSGHTAPQLVSRFVTRTGRAASSFGRQKFSFIASRGCSWGFGRNKKLHLLRTTLAAEFIQKFDLPNYILSASILQWVRLPEFGRPRPVPPEKTVGIIRSPFGGEASSTNFYKQITDQPGGAHSHGVYCSLQNSWRSRVLVTKHHCKAPNFGASYFDIHHSEHGEPIYHSNPLVEL